MCAINNGGQYEGTEYHNHTVDKKEFSITRNKLASILGDHCSGFNHRGQVNAFGGLC
jgi:hypothetical protein